MEESMNGYAFASCQRIARQPTNAEQAGTLVGFPKRDAAKLHEAFKLSSATTLAE